MLSYNFLIIQFPRAQSHSLFLFFLLAYSVIHLFTFSFLSVYFSLSLCYCSFRGTLYANSNGYNYRKPRVIVSHSLRLLSYVISAASSSLFSVRYPRLFSPFSSSLSLWIWFRNEGKRWRSSFTANLLISTRNSGR